MHRSAVAAIDHEPFVMPAVSEPLTSVSLVITLALEIRTDERAEHDGSLRVLGLRSLEHEAFACGLQRAADPRDLEVTLDVGPSQPEDLARAHAGPDREGGGDLTG